MLGRVFFDGLNLSLAQGTGVATYTRMLAQVVRDLGYEVGVVYGSAQRPPKDPLLREVAFFDEKPGDQDVAVAGRPQLARRSAAESRRRSDRSR